MWLKKLQQNKAKKYVPQSTILSTKGIIISLQKITNEVIALIGKKGVGKISALEYVASVLQLNFFLIDISLLKDIPLQEVYQKLEEIKADKEKKVCVALTSIFDYQTTFAVLKIANSLNIQTILLVNRYSDLDSLIGLKNIRYIEIQEPTHIETVAIVKEFLQEHFGQTIGAILKTEYLNVLVEYSKILDGTNPDKSIRLLEDVIIQLIQKTAFIEAELDLIQSKIKSISLYLTIEKDKEKFSDLEQELQKGYDKRAVLIEELELMKKIDKERIALTEEVNNTRQQIQSLKNAGKFVEAGILSFEELPKQIKNISDLIEKNIRIPSIEELKHVVISMLGFILPFSVPEVLEKVKENLAIELEPTNSILSQLSLYYRGFRKSDEPTIFDCAGTQGRGKKTLILKILEILQIDLDCVLYVTCNKIKILESYVLKKQHTIIVIDDILEPHECELVIRCLKDVRIIEKFRNSIFFCVNSSCKRIPESYYFHFTSQSKDTSKFVAQKILQSLCSQCTFYSGKLITYEKNVAEFYVEKFFNADEEKRKHGLKSFIIEQLFETLQADASKFGSYYNDLVLTVKDNVIFLRPSTAK